jgi:hypothetical protein
MYIFNLLSLENRHLRSVGYAYSHFRSVSDPGSGAFLAPGSGMEKTQIRIPGWKKFGSRINIPDPQHCFIHIGTTHTQY